jgi:hypothetical protein
VGTDHAPQARFDTVVVNASLLQPNADLRIPGSLLTQNDFDPDQNDDLAVAGVDGSHTLGKVAVDDGDVLYRPASGFVPPNDPQAVADQFNYKVTDEHGLTSTASVAIMAQAGPNIVGTTGDDLIIGAANDTLTGMAGGDVFVFGPGSGTQTVTDFHQGQGVNQGLAQGYDVLDVSAFGFTETQLQALIDATNPGDHSLTLAPNTTIVLAGVDVHGLDAGHDFILHHAGSGSA